MTCPYSRSRYRWLRNFCSLLCAIIGCCSLPAARAQSLDLEKPLLNIDEDISACEAVQVGTRSPYFSVGPLARTHEHPITLFQDHLLAVLDG